MGSSSSRLGPRPPRPPRTPRSRRKKSLSSLLLCAGSCSHAPLEMEVVRAEVVHSTQHSDPVINKLQSTTTKEAILDTETEFSIPKIITASPESDVIATGNSLPEDSLANVGTSNQWKHFSESKELVPPPPHPSGDRASTSYEEDQLPLEQPMGAHHLDVQEQISPSSQDSIDSWSDRASVENHASESTSIHILESRQALSNDSLRDDNLQEGIIPSSSGLVSSSSNALSSTSPEINNNNREGRRNSRRLFWDAFSRRSSRRLRDSRTFVLSTDDSDDSGPNNDRWVLDFNGEFFDDGFGNDSGHFGGSITDSINERRWHSRSEMWERLRRSGNGRDVRTNDCPCGNGIACTCESVSISDESGAHASISRIVMLAEALFEVLDEIHRQPVALSLSMVSLPAPESVVDSLLVKFHNSSAKTGDDDVDQCLICLAEYEEGDKIRVLPCCHEFHMSCVDKWLKEIHGVCPLCRGDVRDGSTSACFSNSESPYI